MSERDNDIKDFKSRMAGFPDLYEHPEHRQKVLDKLLEVFILAYDLGMGLDPELAKNFRKDPPHEEIGDDPATLGKLILEVFEIGLALSFTRKFPFFDIDDDHGSIG